MFKRLELIPSSYPTHSFFHHIFTYFYSLGNIWREKRNKTWKKKRYHSISQNNYRFLVRSLQPAHTHITHTYAHQKRGRGSHNRHRTINGSISKRASKWVRSVGMLVSIMIITTYPKASSMHFLISLYVTTRQLCSSLDTNINRSSDPTSSYVEQEISVQSQMCHSHFSRHNM